MKLQSILLLVTLASIVQACNPGVSKENPLTPKGEVIPVKVIAVTQQDLQSNIQTAGTFTTDDETWFAFKTGGVIQKIYVKEGDAIRKGQLLAQLNLTEIEAQVAQAQLAYDKSVRDFKRVQNLYRDSVATLEQFQNASTGKDVATRQLDAALFNREYSQIRAVSTGFVLRKLASEGQVIAPGSPVLQTNGAGNTQWILKAGVSDLEWALIKVGDKATVTSDASEKAYAAQVTRKSSGTDATSGTFTIELTLNESASGLASGMFGKATIESTTKQKVWRIPYDALLDGNAKQGYVFATEDQKTVRKVPVVVHSISKNEVIIQAGLEKVTSVIASGSAYLREGSFIQVQ